MEQLGKESGSMPSSFEPLCAFDCATKALRAGLAVVFPTDTVYGLGISVAHAHSPEVLYAIKQRDRGKPIAWLIGSTDDLYHFGKEIPEWARILAQRFWPGDLTLVVRAADTVPEAFRSDAGTIGLRMPHSTYALRLIKALGAPLATTSANRSGAPDVATYDALDSHIAASAGAVIPGWDVVSEGVSSTVVDASSDAPQIMRAGARVELVRQELVRSGVSF